MAELNLQRQTELESQNAQTLKGAQDEHAKKQRESEDLFS